MDKPKYDRNDDVFFGPSIWRAKRKTGPVYIRSPGLIRFCNSESHVNSRKVGPSLVFSDGEVHYYLFDKLHRTNGPAVIYDTGDKEYWINGERLDQFEYFLKYGTT